MATWVVKARNMAFTDPFFSSRGTTVQDNVLSDEG